MTAQTPAPLDEHVPTPPANPPSDVAHDVSQKGAEDNADPSSASASGADADENASGESNGDDSEGAEAPQEGGQAAAGDGTKKKRRRKRSKKKPAAEGGAAPRPSARPASERSPFHAGEEVFGRVTAVLDGAIMVDLAGKALAIFDRSEMEPDDLVPAVGDRFVASVLRDGSRGGLVVLSRKPLREEAAKGLALEAHKSGTPVQGLVTGVIKGGVEVSIFGLRAFAPASGMDLHPQNANFASLVG